MADDSALTATTPCRSNRLDPVYSALTARKPSMGEDVARSALSGLESGAIGLATLPGDLQSLIRSKLEGLGLPEGRAAAEHLYGWNACEHADEYSSHEGL